MVDRAVTELVAREFFEIPTADTTRDSLARPSSFQIFSRNFVAPIFIMTTVYVDYRLHT